MSWSRSLSVSTVAVAATTALVVVPASAPGGRDGNCLRAGILALESAGRLGEVSRKGLDARDRAALGIRPRPGVAAGAVPDPVPFGALLADHAAGADSLLLYPWCPTSH